jgi:hypothetical protein
MASCLRFPRGDDDISNSLADYFEEEQRSTLLERIESDADQMHQIHRSLWPPFERAFLAAELDSPRDESTTFLPTRGKQRKAKLLQLRVFFKTMPLRLWVLIAIEAKGRISTSSRLAFAGSKELDETVEELAAGKVPETASIHVVFALFFYCPFVLSAQGGDNLDPHLLNIATSALSSIFPFQTVFRDITQRYHDLVEISHLESLMARFETNDDFQRMPLFMEAPSEIRRKVMLSDQSYATASSPFELRIWENRKTKQIHGLVLMGSMDATEGPPGHVHGGCLATIGDIVSAYTVRSAGIMTLSLEIRYRMPVPLLSILQFVGALEDGGANVDFFDVRNQLHFSTRGVFSRPKVASKL